MPIKLPIYMDHHATTPVDPRVLSEMMSYFNHDFGNAASIDHTHGQTASKAVETAREKIASSINARPEEIIFTSGATESDNIAIFGVVEKNVSKGNHIITCLTEHKAILDSCKRLEERGFHVSYLPVDKRGIIDLEKLEKEITKKTILITVMFANNEIGTIAPISEIGKIAKDHQILFHTDAAQAFGHMKIDVRKFNINLMSLSAHKMYGPKGIGALYVQRSSPKAEVSPIMYCGGHERGIRSWTLNVPGIVGFGKAIEISNKEMKKENGRTGKWTSKMLAAFRKELNAELNGHETDRLSHNLNLFIKGIENKALINLVKNDVSISAGSACTTAKVEPSHVIQALGYDKSRSFSSIRFGLGRFNTNEEIDHVIDHIIEASMKLQKLKATSKFE